jgi:ribonuclease J
MENNIKIAIEGGYIESHGTLITYEEAQNLKPSEYALLVTGSQGEPLAALSRIANNQHRQIKITPGDTVVFSSSPIPGNNGAINSVVNQLTRDGATVLTNSVLNQLHASGHPCRQELRLMQKLIRPKNFMPIHGEYHMLRLHVDVAVQCGLSNDHIFICDNGDVVNLQNHNCFKCEKVHADVQYLDTVESNGISTKVIKERKILSQDGIVTITIPILNKNKLISIPHIYTRGFSYFTSINSAPIQTAANNIKIEIEKYISTIDWKEDVLKKNVELYLQDFLYKLTHRHPMIITNILNA